MRGLSQMSSREAPGVEVRYSRGILSLREASHLKCNSKMPRCEPNMADLATVDDPTRSTADSSQTMPRLGREVYIRTIPD